MPCLPSFWWLDLNPWNTVSWPINIQPVFWFVYNWFSRIFPVQSREGLYFNPHPPKKGLLQPPKTIIIWHFIQTYFCNIKCDTIENVCSCQYLRLLTECFILVRSAMLQFLTWLYTGRTIIIFGTLKDSSLKMKSLSSNNCFSYRNVVQNGANALANMVIKKIVYFFFFFFFLSKA